MVRDICAMGSDRPRQIQRTNMDLIGRALAVQPEGIFDLKDDLEDGWAGDQLRPIMQRRRDAGFDA